MQNQFRKPLRKLLRVIVIVAACGTAWFGVRWSLGWWAPAWKGEGLILPADAVVMDAAGHALAPADNAAFLKICRSLRSTKRAIGESRGTGWIDIQFPGTSGNETITVYSGLGVVFEGWWIDAKTWEMMGRQAPCFEFSGEMEEFVKRHGLLRSPG